MKRLTRGKAISTFCAECMGWDGYRGGNAGTSYAVARRMARECTDSGCPLYRYRTGIEENKICEVEEIRLANQDGRSVSNG